MHDDPAAFDRALHLLLFLSGAVAAGIGALAALERLTNGPGRTIRMWHVVTPFVTFGALLIAERLYHAVS